VLSSKKWGVSLVIEAEERRRWAVEEAAGAEVAVAGAEVAEAGAEVTGKCKGRLPL